MAWGSFLIATAALKTPTRNGYNAQGVNLTCSLILGYVMSDFRRDIFSPVRLTWLEVFSSFDVVMSHPCSLHQLYYLNGL